MMAPFVRFILSLLIVGIAVNLVIVIAADTAGHRQQVQEMAEEQRLFQNVIQKYNDARRRAEIAVEDQRIGASSEVLESKLLVRRLFNSVSEDPKTSQTPRISRTVIAGNRVSIDGMELKFSDTFLEEFKSLRNTKLNYFWHIYAEGRPPESGLMLFQSQEVPEATRIHPESTSPSFFEIHLWHVLGGLIDDPERAAKAGLTVTHSNPVTRTVRVGKVYVATLGGLEDVTFEEDNTPGLFQSIKSAADALPDSHPAQK